MYTRSVTLVKRADVFLHNYNLKRHTIWIEACYIERP
jgi:hypothetical protein